MWDSGAALLDFYKDFQGAVPCYLCGFLRPPFPLLLQYSNMFKPYITDGFFCLLTVIFYQRYLTGRMEGAAPGDFLGRIDLVFQSRLALWRRTDACGCVLSTGKNLFAAFAREDGILAGNRCSSGRQFCGILFLLAASDGHR